MSLSVRHLLITLLFMPLVVHAQPKVVFVEGNIGVGKSTFLKVIQNYLDVVTIAEPCDEWQNIAGHNLLDAFYKDSARWACTFQLYAFMTRVKKQQAYSELGGQVQIMERSWFSDRYCFAYNAFLSGMINDMEWNLYLDIWDWYARQVETPVGFIYLRTNPETCYERMKERARCEESIVPLEYLQLLHSRHEEWLIEGKYKDHYFGRLPVLVLDGSCNFRDDQEVQKKFVKQILDFLHIHENIDFRK